MKLSQEEIKEELSNLQSILRMHRRRRRVLEEQAAHAGSSIDAKVLLEIEDISEQIRSYETEFDQLEQQAAAATTPVAEIEYRMLLAQAWSKYSERIPVVERAQLEWARVRLGILSEHAQNVESRIRADLARESLADIRIENVQHAMRQVAQKPPGSHPFDNASTFQSVHMTLSPRTDPANPDYAWFLEDIQTRLLRAVFLDSPTACEWIIGTLKQTGVDLAASRITRSVWLAAQLETRPSRKSLIEQFIAELSTVLEQQRYADSK